MRQAPCLRRSGQSYCPVKSIPDQANGELEPLLKEPSASAKIPHIVRPSASSFRPRLLFASDYALNVPQITRQKPDQPAATIHLAADAAVGRTNYGALRRRISPKAVVAHKFDAIPRLKSIECH